MKFQEKIVELDKAVSQIEELKRDNQKIVFTNGCFDLLHKGHITYLEKAGELGDFLVVGLNSDDSVRRLKGENRPVKSLVNRISVLAGLASVDMVIPFEEDTPLLLIQQINPDVLVKGGDYSMENIVGADFVLNEGGRVELIKFVEGFSSSAIINKMENI
ncbi:MAG: D-glycero-beta-D-manno-heptose 1-phosphate adenylyltransferase [Bacteroidota bacterium]